MWGAQRKIRLTERNDGSPGSSFFFLWSTVVIMYEEVENGAAKVINQSLVYSRLEAREQKSSEMSEAID